MRAKIGKALGIITFVVGLPGALPVILAVSLYGAVKELRREEPERPLRRLSVMREPNYRLLIKERGEYRMATFSNEAPAVGVMRVKRKHQHLARLWRRDPDGGLEELHANK